MKRISAWLTPLTASAISLALAAAFGTIPAALADSSAPAASAVTVVQAKDANAKGKWSLVEHSLASQGTYMAAGKDGVGTVLEFAIEVDKPTGIAVTPQWFAHGDQKRSLRFPDTLPYFYVQQTWPMKGNWYDYNASAILPAPVISKPGPDAIDVLGSKAFFSAPAGGRVGVLDLASEKIVGIIDVGGYVSDLAVDAAAGKLVVADAGNNRLIVYDAATLKQEAQIPVPELPFSIAVYEGKVFVASMVAKKVSVVDLKNQKITASIDLPVAPQHVSIEAGQKPRLVVQWMPMTFDLKTLQEIPADRQTYWPSNRYGQEVEKSEQAAMEKAAAAYPKAQQKVFFYGRRPTGWTLDAGPSRALCRSSYLQSVMPSKLYLADASSKSVIVLDENGKKLKDIDLGATPSDLQIFDLQLCAVSKEAKKVYLISILEDKVVNTLSLPGRPDEFFVGCLIPRYTTVEQMNPAPVINGTLKPRLAFGLAPRVFDLQTLAAIEQDKPTFLPIGHRNHVAVPGDKARHLQTDNLHTILISEKPGDVEKGRWVDTTAVTDSHLASQPARLMPKDASGAVTLSLDNGPECDWENDVWFTPDHRAMLVRGTEQFDLHNAVRFSLSPGKHVLKVRAASPYANLEGLKIVRTLADRVDVQITPLPEDVHGKVPLLPYNGVFAAGEPVSFQLKVAAKDTQSYQIAGDWSVRNYLGEAVLEGKAQVSVTPQTVWQQPLNLDLKEPGRYILCLKLNSPEGTHEVYHRFVKLAKLDYPRLLCRAEEFPQIKARIAKYPKLFQRYRDYLRRQSETADYLPKLLRGAWGQEMVKENSRWRAICLQFADLFLEDGQKRYEKKLVPLLAPTGGYNAWQGNYEFGDAHTLLEDVMLPTSEAAKANLDKGYRDPKNGYIVEGNIQGFAFPDYFLTLREPLTPVNRVVLDRIANELDNYDAYFQAHAGSRGGNWWHGTNAMCHCPVHSMVRAFLYCRTFFGEKQFFERTNIRGVLTLQSYAYPRYDTKTFVDRSAFRETWDTVKNTEAMRWALSGLSRLGLEKTYYSDVFETIKKLNGPMADEEKEVDALLGPGSGVVIPMYVALGWLDPEAKAVAWEELPPSMLFDAEGAACMKSSWDKNMTDIYFVSGIKDITYKTLPNHFTIFRSGEMVVGANRTGDHGCPVPFYGNCVRVGEDERFAGYTVMGWGYPRQEERWVTDCFSTLGYTYMFRDWRLSGYCQEGTRWEGGGHPHAYPREVTLHSHTSHPFVADGKVLAYETSPLFDYVAGDATNFWYVDEVQEAYRQFVYIRPDVVVVYDRLALESPKTLKWPLMTLRNAGNQRGNPALTGETFTASNDVASLWGHALLPKGGKINSTTIGVEGWKPDSIGYMEVEPAQKARQGEFLVVLRVGGTQPQPLQCTLLEQKDGVGVSFVYENKNYRILFGRSGGVSGSVRIDEGGKVLVNRPLVTKISDTYGHWQGTPQFKKWMTEDRFKPYVSEADRKQYGK